MNLLELKELAIETKLVKSTSKRQITIPKSFYGLLKIQEGQLFTAHLLNEGIILIPNNELPETIRDHDRRTIIEKVIKEGYAGTALAEELTRRLKLYDDFIDRKIAQFEEDIKETIIT